MYCRRGGRLSAVVVDPERWDTLAGDWDPAGGDPDPLADVGLPSLPDVTLVLEQAGRR